MGQIITAIIAIAKAVPVISTWLEMLLDEFAKYKKYKINKETIERVDEAIKTGDQRDLESPEHSGKPSGYGDVITRKLPGVSEQAKD